MPRKKRRQEQPPKMKKTVTNHIEQRKKTQLKTKQYSLKLKESDGSQRQIL